MANKRLPASVWVVFGILCFVWGTTYFGIKIGVQYFPPFFFSAIRHILAGFLFVIPFLLRGYKLPNRRDFLRLGIAGCFMVTGGNALISWAELYIPSGLAGILSTLSPLFTTILSIFFFKGFRVTSLIFIGMTLSIAGIIFLSKPESTEVRSEYFILGVVLVFCANIFWALGAIFIKKYPVDVNIYLRTGLQMLIAGSVNMVISFIFEPIPNLAAVPISGWQALTYLVLVGSMVGYSSFVYVLDYMSPARISIHVYVNTIVAVIVGWLFGNENLTPFMVGTMVVVLSGVLIVNREYAKMAITNVMKS